MARRAQIVVALSMVLLGGVWLLQGLNLLPGSFMTGSTGWGVAGAVLIAGGTALLARQLRS